MTTPAPRLRRSNWPALLALFLAEKRAQPFDWAENNCAFFACDWLALATGVDPAADFRGTIDSPLAALRALEAGGGLETLVVQACARWDWPEVPPAYARRGDLATLAAEGGPALGVVVGAQVACAGPSGVEFRPLAASLRAWRIN